MDGWMDEWMDGWMDGWMDILVLFVWADERMDKWMNIRRAFSIVGPSTWNGLPLEIRILPKNNESAFCRLLKTDLYRRGWAE